MIIVRSFLIKLSIVALWIGLIFSVLYWEHFISGSHKTLNIFGWAGMFDPVHIAKFERETGIRVNISYYESNEELLVKLKATQGKGYDIIVPSDYAVYLLRKENILKKLDKSRLSSFYKKLNPALLNHYYDPFNDYSLPYEWSIFGIGYDKEYFKDSLVKSWSLLFDPELLSYKIGMVNDPRAAVAFAAYHLFQSPTNITMDKLKLIKEALIIQRPWVLAYSDLRADYMLASKDVVAAVVSSSYILRSMRKYSYIGFFIPKEGAQVTIENIAIPRATDKDELIYKFIEFMFTDENIINNFEQLAFFPPTTAVLEDINAPKDIKQLMYITPEQFKHLDFIKTSDLKPPITEQTLQDMWVSIKS